MASPSKREVKQLSEQLSRQAVQNERRKPETRDDLARMLVAVFAALLIMVVVGGPLFNAFFSNWDNFELFRVDVEANLQAISTVMGPVIGFVIGYYFKSRSE